MTDLKHVDVNFDKEALEVIGATRIVEHLVKTYPVIGDLFRAGQALDTAVATANGTNGTARKRPPKSNAERRETSKRMKLYWVNWRKKKVAAEKAARAAARAAKAAKAAK